MNKPKSPAEFKAACQKIKLFLFDCDGVLTDGRIVLGSRASELKFFYTFDGLGIKMWSRLGFLTGCITGRTSEAVELRAQELTIDEVHQGIAKKGECIEQIAQKRGLSLDEIAYVGDDLNDLSAGLRAGLFFIPANHHYLMKPYADYVLRAEGGHGAIREAIDMLIEQKGLMEQVLKSYTE